MAKQTHGTFWSPNSIFFFLFLSFFLSLFFGRTLILLKVKCKKNPHHTKV